MITTPHNCSRRDFLATLAWASAGFAATPKLPNIVYVLADDLGWGDLDCYNPDSAIPTPYANRFATEGVRFTDMHSPSSVCTPTRYGILTGRYCWRSRLKQGVLQGYSPSLIEPGRLTVPAMLQERGYYTAGVGKWHLGLGDRERTDYTRPLHPGPVDRGFEYYYGIPSSLDFEPYLYFENDRVVEQPTSTTKGATQPPRGVFWRPGAIAPHFEFPQVLPTLTAKAVSIIRERASHPGPPFFLYFAMPAPHTPWVPIPPFLGRSKAGLYGDFVAQVDDSFGQVLAAIDQAGIASDTLIIFTSDNGAHWTPEDKAAWPHRANANWRGMKADIWDAGHRIPFLARWTGRIRPGTVSSQLGCLTDLMATAAALTRFHVPHDAGEDSYNLLPALLGTARRPIRQAVVHHSNQGMFSIRERNWKLELGLGSGGFSTPAHIDPVPGGPEGQLYDLSKDPEETVNLYQQHPEIVARLTALLERYRREGRSRP
ncbi:MAG TPA: sulfatase-like hydrolase/transferase [Candidatus Acidoferrales bacterium]|nr:sulfatase-like hydrolase/transferase [Candidatus Acidoferrales bacterium]